MTKPVISSPAFPPTLRCTSSVEISIDISNVTRRFGTTVAVNGLSLQVGRGEIFALVGPDGAGKTTLMRLICGALAIDAGSLSVDGVDVVRSTAAVQSVIGYMPQRFSLYPDLSVMENLRFYGDIFGVPKEQFAERAKAFLTDFSLTPFVSRLAEELSGGMKQKLALACALIHSPMTILLDEPTAGVDPISRREFWRILYGINARGTTIFVSTPYMDEAERAHRVAFITQGWILSCGTPDELKRELQGAVVEISCSKRADARRALRAEPLVRSVEVFGEALHALVGSAATAIPTMRERLLAFGVSDVKLREIPPSLEDTFVARLTP
jgi:ABC-2 type transport system ATP-binding protein